MRSIQSKAIMAGLALIGWAASISTGTAQITPQYFRLLTFTNKWHFNPSGQDLHLMVSTGLDWRLPGYNDTNGALGWDIGAVPSSPKPGFPLFGFPNQNQLASWPPGFQTLFPNPVPQVPYIVTYYYRTHFIVPTNNPANLVLVITNWIDDGVVYWLNGATELTRLRMPTNLVGTNLTYHSLATPNTDAPPADILIVGPTNLLAGDNLIAAEVHQQALTSSDDVFGIENMSAIVEAPIVITNQPISTTAVVGKPVSLKVGGTGSFPFYSWHKVGLTNPVAAGTSNYVFGFASPQLANSGTYYVTITNRFGTVTSSNVVLTVVPDTFGPLLLSATIIDTSNKVLQVTFDEVVNSLSVTNVSNYTVNLLGKTNQWQVTNAVYAGFSIRLSLASPLVPTNEYSVTVSNVRDASRGTNVIAPNSWVGVSFTAVSNIFGLNSVWRFDDNEFGALDAAWVDLNYPDDPTVNFNWCCSPAAAGIYAVTQTGNFHPCSPWNTLLSLGANTMYFRTKFNLSTNFGPHPTLRFTNVVDDGAVFYLNGTEIRRDNMPAGVIGYNTTPLVERHDVTCQPAFTTNLDSGILVKGANILAVEVHQYNQPVPDPFSDVAFGCRLDILVPITPALPPDVPNPTLSIARVDPMTVNISWGKGHGFALEGTDNPAGGSWIQVPNMATNTTISVTNAMQFYRLHKVQPH